MPRKVKVVVDKTRIGNRQGASGPVTKDPWHAVSLVGGPVICAVATELRGQRFLPLEAPRLPMPNCAWPLKCACVYRHHADRRAIPRRASDRGRPWTAVVPERRGMQGRRADD